MPKEDIDYSNTVIYKIYCKDKIINEVYVGHTTNFTKRKYNHKHCCSNLDNKLKIYNTIRQHGGWDNWNIIPIAIYNCKDKTDALIKEQEHYELLGASLNSCPPCSSKNKYVCSLCDMVCANEKAYKTHTDKHKSRTKLNDFMPKMPKNYFCEVCDFKCSKLSNWDNHLMTAKHQNRTILNNFGPKNAENMFTCENCDKTYKARNSLWYHKKTCVIIKNAEETKDITDKNLMLTLITQNSELQKQMLDIIKSGTTNINNNSHNKTFNLQLFLNETCKDAMNIMDFVDSIKFQLSDLESVGELGYVNGISNIIIKNLKALDENMRPVHCSDLKREKIYIKDDGKWEKESADNKILKNAIKYIAHKNVKMIPAFREKYPDCVYSDSRKSDQYNNLIIEAMGGEGNDEDGKANKIIKRIAKEILIDKI
jgi:hypothetical protein